MKKIGGDIWVYDDAMSLAGTQLRLRMTIVKLANGGLWVHSPTAKGYKTGNLQGLSSRTEIS